MQTSDTAPFVALLSGRSENGAYWRYLAHLGPSWDFQFVPTWLWRSTRREA